MDDETRQSALFRTSHITILLSYTFFSVILIGESLLLGWEIWALILIAIALLLSWFIHIRQKLPDDMRLWIYSILMMGTFFFYGSHITSTYDLCPTMCIVILIYTMTGYKHLVVLCQVTYYMTMCLPVLRKRASDRRRSYSFDKLIFQKASPAIAVNCGAGTFGLLYKIKDKV